MIPRWLTPGSTSTRAFASHSPNSCTVATASIPALGPARSLRDRCAFWKNSLLDERGNSNHRTGNSFTGSGNLRAGAGYIILSGAERCRAFSVVGVLNGRASDHWVRAALNLALAPVVILQGDARLRREAVCPSRGASVSAGNRFCRRCGALQVGVQPGLAFADCPPSRPLINT